MFLHSKKSFLREGNFTNSFFSFEKMKPIWLQKDINRGVVPLRKVPSIDPLE